MACNFGKWQPIGDQFPAACSVCAHRRDTVMTVICKNCRMEKESGFEFDPNRLVESYRDRNKEKFLFDGEKYYAVGGMRGAGKILHLELMLDRTRAELKEVREARDAYKQLADDLSSIIKEMVRKKE